MEEYINFLKNILVQIKEIIFMYFIVLIQDVHVRAGIMLKL